MNCNHKTELSPVVNNFMQELARKGYKASLSTTEGPYCLIVNVEDTNGVKCSVNVYYGPNKKRFTPVINGKFTESQKADIKECLKASL